jgi:hypothetical protein
MNTFPKLPDNPTEAQVEQYEATRAVLVDVLAGRSKRSLETTLELLVANRDRFLAGLKRTGSGVPETPEDRAEWASYTTKRAALESELELVDLAGYVRTAQANVQAARAHYERRQETEAAERASKTRLRDAEYRLGEWWSRFDSALARYHVHREQAERIERHQAGGARA